MKAVKEPISQHFIVPIPPHGGGPLVNRLLPSPDAQKAVKKSGSYPKIHLSSRALSDLEMLAIGAYSPLDGFMRESDYLSVVNSGRLRSGLLWPIPLTLPVDEEAAAKISIGSPAALVHDDELRGIIFVDSLYKPDKKLEAGKVFKTTDHQHPGVADVFNRGSWCVGGRVEVISLPERINFSQFNLTPRDTRRIFQEKNWTTIVGFQTRNPMHRGHEDLVKKALETVDGALIHPMVGESKEGDFPADVRMKCYEILINNYFPADKVVLAANPGHMYFAGPREAILHAIVRQNYGCTHFIVGRDHAGIGSYYAPTEAQDLISWFLREDLNIQPVFPEVHSSVSGTQIKEMIRAGITPPVDMMRPEVSAVLLSGRKI